MKKQRDDAEKRKREYYDRPGVKRVFKDDELRDTALAEGVDAERMDAAFARLDVVRAQMLEQAAQTLDVQLARARTRALGVVRECADHRVATAKRWYLDEYRHRATSPPSNDRCKDVGSWGQAKLENAATAAGIVLVEPLPDVPKCEWKLSDSNPINPNEIRIYVQYSGDYRDKYMKHVVDPETTDRKRVIDELQRHRRNPPKVAIGTVSTRM